MHILSSASYLVFFTTHVSGVVMRELKFGSQEVFERYMQEAARRFPKKAHLPLNLNDALSFEIEHESSSPSYFSEEDEIATPTLIDTSVRNSACFCCFHCHPVPDSSPIKTRQADNLLLLWNKIKLASSSTDSTVAPSPALSPPSDDEYEQISAPNLPTIDPPNNQTPSSVCADCGSALLSAKAFSNPPGFCEYSGRLICGACFEPRPVVLPWKLVSGFSSFRGSVSRTAARLIQSSIYMPYIQTEDLIERNQRGSRIFSKCLELRDKVRFAKMKTKCVSIELVGIPSHISETDSWSIADLIDLFTPGKESVILTALAKANATLAQHACMHCTGPCLVCDSVVSDFAETVFRCGGCGYRFHRHCIRWSLGDGCLGCANLLIPKPQSIVIADSDSELSLV